jgi:hypothetical protein
MPRSLWHYLGALAWRLPPKERADRESSRIGRLHSTRPTTETSNVPSSALYHSLAPHPPTCTELLGLKRALDDPAIDAESGARGGRREWTGDVSHQGSDLLGRGKSLDEGGRAHLLEELLLELVERFSIGLCERFDEVANATRLLTRISTSG